MAHKVSIHASAREATAGILSRFPCKAVREGFREPLADEAVSGRCVRDAAAESTLSSEVRGIAKLWRGEDGRLGFGDET